MIACHTPPLEAFEYEGEVYDPCGMAITMPMVGQDGESATIFMAKMRRPHWEIRHFFLWLAPLYGIGDRIAKDSVVIRIGMETWEPDEDGYSHEVLLDLELPEVIGHPFSRPPMLAACWDLMK